MAHDSFSEVSRGDAVTSDAQKTDWGAWSRESVALMQRRNDQWRAQFQLTNDPFRWDLETATIRFQRANDQVVASLCLIGTISATEGTFLWGWANDATGDVTCFFALKSFRVEPLDSPAAQR